MGFSDELRQRAASTWDKEKAHPFVTGIGDGTLPLDNFRYYMRQDYVFLIEFCRAISLAVAKARTLEDMGWFAQMIHETLNMEMALHVSFCADFDITEEELLATKALSHDMGIYEAHDKHGAPGDSWGDRGGDFALLVGIRRDRPGAVRAGNAREPASLYAVDRDL